MIKSFTNSAKTLVKQCLQENSKTIENEALYKTANKIKLKALSLLVSGLALNTFLS